MVILAVGHDGFWIDRKCDGPTDGELYMMGEPSLIVDETKYNNNEINQTTTIIMKRGRRSFSDWPRDRNERPIRSTDSFVYSAQCAMRMK